MNVYLVFLEWPEKCFRTSPEALAVLRGLVPKGSRIVRARTEKAFLRALPSATHVITWPFKEEWFKLAPKLKVLATPSAGRELVPLEGPKGVKIHFGGFHGPAMAESVLALMLAWCRGVVAGERLGHWPKVALSERCYRLAGTRAVILGYGKIGHAIGDRLAAFGVEVVGIRRHNISRLRAEAKKADWLICVLPSDTGTDDIVDAKLVAALPKRCVVVNVGRGNAIDEAALASALKRGRIAAALLDVWKKEPLQKDSPLGGDDVPNLVRMPHSAAFYPEYIADSIRELAREGLLK